VCSRLRPIRLEWFPSRRVIVIPFRNLHIAAVDGVQVELRWKDSALRTVRMMNRRVRSDRASSELNYLKVRKYSTIASASCGRSL
jgi:hypothetical protein